MTTRVVELDGGESIEIPCGDGRGAQWVDKGNNIAAVVARKKTGGKTVHKEWLEADE